MALTIAAPKRYSVGDRWQTVTQVTLDNSYPTGGYALTGQQLGLPSGLTDWIDSSDSPNGGYVLAYNLGTGKLQVFQGAAAVSLPGAEVPAATNLAAVTTTVVCTGK